MKENTQKAQYSAWLWLLPFVFVALVRFNLPGEPGSTSAMHNAIIQSILEGNKWGLMALVKIPDVPLVPTLALLVCKSLPGILGDNAMPLLCALSQAAVLVMLLRAMPKSKAWSPYAMMALAALPAIPLFRNALAADDCNWISAVPLAHALLILFRDGKELPLKSVLILACDSAILIFCGPIMLTAALLILLVTAADVVRNKAPRGTLCILLMPAAYALALWIPWYSPFSDNIFTETLAAYSHLDEHVFTSAIQPNVFIMAAAAFGPLIFRVPVSRLLLVFALAIPGISALSNGIGFSQAGIAPASVVLVGMLFPVIARPFALMPASAPTRPVTVFPAVVCACAALVLACSHPSVSVIQRATPEVLAKHAAPAEDIFPFSDAPSRETLEALADEIGLNTRIVIVGSRLQRVVYPDAPQVRFRPMDTFSPEEFQRLASAEQLCLLVPPPDGRFYGDDSPLKGIHAAGAPYLFPAASLPGGWQLWQSIPRPKY